jgi:hypothetical protein
MSDTNVFLKEPKNEKNYFARMNERSSRKNPA